MPVRTRVHIKEGIGRGLCGSCANSTVVRFTTGDDYYRCEQISFGSRGGRIPAPVSECSDYHPINTPTKFEMKEVAWVLETKKGKVIGFLSPEEAKEKGISRRILEDL